MSNPDPTVAALPGNGGPAAASPTGGSAVAAVPGVAAGDPGGRRPPGDPAASSTPAGEAEYFAGVTFESEEDRRGAATVGEQLRAEGAPAREVNAAWAAMQEVFDLGEALGPQEIQHAYRVPDGFTADDRPALTAILNRAHAAGVSQHTIDVMARRYLHNRAAQQGEGTDADLDASDRASYAQARRSLGQDWSAQDARAVVFFVESLPPNQRDQVDNDPTLFTPAKLRELARAGKALLGSQRYRSDAGLQSLYRNVIGRQSTGAPKSGGLPSGEAQELASLRSMMGNRNSPYWKGKDAERNQARYRALIERGQR